MTAPSPVISFYRATVAAAAAAGRAGGAPSLSEGFGCAGLFARVGVAPHAASDPAAHRLRRLYDVLLLERAAEIGAALDAAGVEHVFVKGIALLDAVYRPGDRVISDLDLHVQPPQRRLALERLGALGYAPWPERDQAGPPELRSALALGRTGAGDVDQVTVDLHWALDPLDRLLPRAAHLVPLRLWAAVGRPRALRVPTAEHHAALLVRHLVHSDLLHVRNLLDVALLFADLPDDAGAEYLAAADEMGVGMVARAVGRLLARDLGVDRPRACGAGRLRPTFLDRLTLERVLATAARARPGDTAAVTVGRIRRRLAVLGPRAASRILADVFFPPRAFLVWRWPGRRVGAARARHYRQLVSKVLHFR